MTQAARNVPDGLEPFSELAQDLNPRTVIRFKELLAKKTTLKVGGPADCYIEPFDEGDLALVLRFCDERGIPAFILGRGSNLLIRDGGIRGAVICLNQPFFSRIEVYPESSSIFAGAGARLKHIAVEAKRNLIGGLEFLEGIPGSVGGALRMNAGAMGRATFEALKTVRFMDREGAVHERDAQDVPVEYRSCSTLKTHVALDATFVGVHTAREAIEELMAQCSEKRWTSQPAAPSAGCIFKNPPAGPSGKLIQELGLKGTGIGGAMVSDVHGNFIINTGEATARDVLQLIELIKKRAREVRGIDLQTEVEIVGEDA